MISKRPDSNVPNQEIKQSRLLKAESVESGKNRLAIPPRHTNQIRLRRKP